VCSRELLLNNVWGLDYYGDPRVVDTHIKNLRKKLGVPYIRTVKGVGYKLDTA
jgi:two-component system, OmpR family, response regulator VanR